MLTRALVTFSFLLFVVASALFLGIGVLATRVFWPAGILFFLVWLVVATPFVGALAVVWLGDEKPRFSPSDLYFEKRNYKSWNSIHGWPRASNLVYECSRCHKSLQSNSAEMTTCGCGNLFIGPEHIGAQDPSKVRLYEQPA